MARSSDSPAEALAEKRLEELVRAYSGAVLSYVRRRVSAEGVEDVVAETFLVAWRRLERVPVDSPLPWLLAVARNVIATQRRAAGRRDALHLRLIEDTPLEVGDQPGVEALEGSVAAAMAVLAEKDREALVLIACEGLQPREAARVLGEPPSAFYVRLHRAKRRLRRQLDKQRGGPAESCPHPLKAKETTP